MSEQGQTPESSDAKRRTGGMEDFRLVAERRTSTGKKIYKETAGRRPRPGKPLWVQERRYHTLSRL